MSYYNTLLFVHIAAAAIWFGGGFLLILLAARMARTNDVGGFEALFRQADFIATKVFIPAGIVVVVAGILLVIEGPWKFDMLWIVLALLGYAATFVTGVFVLTPQAKRIAAAIERDGGMTAESAAATASMFRHMRIDYAVLLVIIADMALKPSADDIGVLIAMAAVLVVVTVATLRTERTPTALERG